MQVVGARTAFTSRTAVRRFCQPGPRTRRHFLPSPLAIRRSSAANVSCCASRVADEDLPREIADLLGRRKSRSEMVGELLREFAVLLIVFVPLEAMFNPGRLTAPSIVVVVLVAFAVAYLGIRLEERHR